MRYLRVTYLRKLIAFFLLIAIVNTTIDPPDFLKNIDADIELEEDLTVNEIESIAELVLEHGMDMDNAIPETDDSDAENLLKKHEVLSFDRQYVVDFVPIVFTLSVEHHSLFTDHFSVFTLSIDSPPPQV